ncbi:hypothetical protein HBI56_237000 [Parastagonospora nodorum]|nr:hypothetical protein HBH53_196050 [Parastagonospora nodorum]KAH3961044.1 hypothetical protein HBH51_185890 [Parastagonospora nodorum]KAH3966777.1 hypothetical protein HBH52_196100 [Parastagonospora nodorum]KAH3992659.1 hypothetical protein HBI10_211560 [Parastagonospora nodorum]KAH4018185.1 hypothetical protein HBI09_191010 [Parastagonospora nodorum]
MRAIILWVLTAAAVVTAQSVTSNGRCGSLQGHLTCKESVFGRCCSRYGWCGDTTGYCGVGCQSGYGACTPSSSPPKSSVSTDGRCGRNGKTCHGSGFGSCCSSKDWCGGSPSHCGVGCKSSFGACSHVASTLRTSFRSSTSASSPISSPSIKISKNARCGYRNGIKTSSLGQSCLNSKWGDCCSQYGYCGSTPAYCSTGCQSGWGSCSLTLSSSTPAKSLPTSSQSSTLSNVVVASFSRHFVCHKLDKDLVRRRFDIG